MTRLTLSGVLLLLACGGAPPARTLAETCVVNTDCTEPLVCAYARCHNACRTDRDCPRGLHCRAAEKPLNVCLLDDELRCPGGRDRECPGNLVCGSDLLCRDGCRADRDCLESQRCLQGTCANVEEIQPDGGLAGALDFRCALNTDCAEPLVCRNGLCTNECRANRDCPPGASCADGGVCERTPVSVIAEAPVPQLDGGVDGGLLVGYGQPCVLNGDCSNLAHFCLGGRCGVECFSPRDCGPGFCCAAGNRCATGAGCEPPPPGFMPVTPDGGCVNDAQCQDSARCNGAERCVGRVCRGAERGLCDDGNPCTEDFCTESSLTCSYRTVVVDADGDGRYPSACGGAADDCDDTNPRIYPGALERCDFIDNNCDGVIDEGRWRPKSGTAASLTVGSNYGPLHGRPHAELAGGRIVVVATNTTEGTIDGFTVDPSTLALTSGPVTLGGSRSAWNTCDSFKARLAGFPRLASNGSQLLLTAAEKTFPGTTCCPQGGGAGAVSVLVRALTPTLGVLDGGLLATVALGENCSSMTPSIMDSTVRVRPGGATFEPQSGRWVLTWAEQQTTNSLSGPVLAATWTVAAPWTSGVQFVPGSASVPAGVMDTNSYMSYDRTPLSVAVDGRVLAVWFNTPSSSATPPRGQRMRYAWLNRQADAVLAGPFDLSLGTNRQPLEALADVSSAWVLADTYLSGDLELWELDSDGGTRARRTVPRPTGNALTGISLGAYRESSARLVDGGILVVATATAGSADNVALYWSSRAADAGFQSTLQRLSTTTLQHTDYALVPTSPTSAAVFWTDGNLQRLAFECVDATP